MRSDPRPFRWSWRLGSVAGIDVFVHFSFVLLLAWLAINHIAAGRPFAALLYGAVTITSVFGVVVLHELGHALTARRFGIRTREITLLPIGGVARLEGMPERPSQELLVALAGPAVNLALAVLLFAGLTLSPSPTDPDPRHLAVAQILANLLWVNATIGFFNLIPAFPMDGGRALRALLAMRMTPSRATEIAAGIGQILAVVFGILGVFWNPMLVVIAMFVWMGAKRESTAARVRETLRGLPVDRVTGTHFGPRSPAERDGP